MLTSLAPIDADAILPLADAKSHLNLAETDTYNEPKVEAARADAIAWAEDETGASLQERQFMWTADEFVSRMRLPRYPVTGVDEINYYGGDGVDTALDVADWYFGSNAVAAAAGTSWPTASGQPGSVRITFTAGYALATDIPFNLLAAVKLAMTAFFENRSNPDLTGARNVATQNRMMVA